MQSKNVQDFGAACDEIIQVVIVKSKVEIIYLKPWQIKLAMPVTVAYLEVIKADAQKRHERSKEKSFLKRNL